MRKTKRLQNDDDVVYRLGEIGEKKSAESTVDRRRTEGKHANCGDKRKKPLQNDPLTITIYRIYWADTLNLLSL